MKTRKSTQMDVDPKIKTVAENNLNKKKMGEDYTKRLKPTTPIEKRKYRYYPYKKSKEAEKCWLKLRGWREKTIKSIKENSSLIDWGGVKSKVLISKSRNNPTLKDNSWVISEKRLKELKPIIKKAEIWKKKYPEVDVDFISLEMKRGGL